MAMFIHHFERPELVFSFMLPEPGMFEVRNQNQELVGE
jgi:hypothetical protein